MNVFLKFECSSLKWTRFGMIADLDCYLNPCAKSLVEQPGFSGFQTRLTRLSQCAKSLVNHGFPGKSGESGLPENQENQALPDYQSG